MEEIGRKEKRKEIKEKENKRWKEREKQGKH